MRGILLTALIFCLAPAAAHEPSRAVTVAAQGWVEAVPDTLQLSITVRKTGADLDRVRGQVDSIAERTAAVASGAGIAEGDIDTSRISSWPEYQWHDGKRRYLGITVQREIQLRLRDLDAYGALLQQLGALELYRIAPPQTSHSSIDALRLEALKAALSLARHKAETIAAEVDAELGPALSVREHSAHTPAPQRVMRAEAMSADSGSTPAVSFARQRISAQVEVEYALR